MVRSTKSPRKTKNVTLKSVSLFFKQLTVASVAASFYAMTFVVFVGLSAPLALCFDPIYWGETPFRTHRSYGVTLPLRNGPKKRVVFSNTMVCSGKEMGSSFSKNVWTSEK